MNKKLIVAVSLGVFSQVGTADEVNMNSLIYQCNQQNKLHDSSKALELSAQILKLDANNSGGLMCKGRALGELNKTAEAITVLDQAAKYASSDFDKLSIATMQGSILKNAQQYDAAIAKYNIALAMSKEAQLNRFERIEHNMLGDTYSLTNAQEKALENYLLGNKLSANDAERADNLTKIAAMYASLGKKTQAIETQLQAVVAHDNTHDLDNMAESKLTLGQYYTANMDFKLAEQFINKTIKMAQEQGGAYWEARGYYTLALTKLAAQQQAEAKALLIQAKKLSDSLGEKELSDDISKALNS